jgi:hypothetical protein
MIYLGGAVCRDGRRAVVGAYLVDGWATEGNKVRFGKGFVDGMLALLAVSGEQSITDGDFFARYEERRS